MTMNTIDSQQQLACAVEELIRIDPRFRRLHEAHGNPPLRRLPQGLESLLRIVTDQLISLSAADAIWRRLSSRLSPFSSDSILRCGEPELRSLGLSGAKARTFVAVAEAERSGFLVEAHISNLDDQSVRHHLMAIPGIGPWTADIYLLSALGRTDAWPAGDVALQTAVGDMLGLDQRPNFIMMQQIAEPWRPWRSVAARFLWVHYRNLKGMPLKNISSSQDRHTIYSRKGGK